MKAVSIETFNLNRLAIFVHNYIKADVKLLSSKKVNETENVWFFAKDEYNVMCDEIAIGVPISNHTNDAKELLKLIDIYSANENCDYILSYNGNKVLISLSKDYKSSTILEAVFQAIIIKLLAKSRAIPTQPWNSDDSITFENLFKLLDYDPKGLELNDMKLLEITRNFVTNKSPSLNSLATKHGWDLTKCLITGDEWRFTVNSKFIFN